MNQQRITDHVVLLAIRKKPPHCDSMRTTPPPLLASTVDNPASLVSETNDNDGTTKKSDDILNNLHCRSCSSIQNAILSL